MVGNKLNMSFSFTSILINRPVEMDLFISILITLSLSCMIKIVEGPVYYINLQSRENLIDFRKIGNCIWYVIITILTGIIVN